MLRKSLLLKYCYHLYVANEEISGFHGDQNLINMRFSLFWNTAQRLLVAICRRFGQLIGSIFTGEAVTSRLRLPYSPEVGYPRCVV